MITLTIILALTIIISGYIIRNLLLKNEKQEDILAGYMIYLNRISGIIELSEKKMNDVDAKGHFKSDDEVGFFFEEIKQIQEVLNEFNIKKL
jgi:hypothetical protein